MLIEERGRARLLEVNSILEWRTRPRRLDGELARFLDEVWETGAGESSETNGDGRSAAPVAG
jgi:hypothetical protein